jgi:nitroimidazol reductase NimA-like FMN-containing flavoprotein (pyridoxamine 5'-phosphate oxidase superfamily)
MEFNKADKITVKRGAKKASYNKKEIYKILDSTEICNIAFSVNELAQVQPINFGRNKNKLYIHGALNNRMTNQLIKKGSVCLSVFYLDSMKLSRSAFHHSVNYRSVVVIGKVKELLSNDEKLYGLKFIINHFVPNRWENCRKPSENELKATKVLEIKIETASAKIANAPVTDNKEDKDLDFWAGYLPIKTICESPINAEDLKEGIEIPKHVQDFYNKNKNGF